MNDTTTTDWLTGSGHRPLIDVGGTRPQPTRPERPVVVCGASGGVGTSVVSALLADYRAAELGERSVWIGLSGSESDITHRLAAVEVGHTPCASNSPRGASLWSPPERSAIASVLDQVWATGTEVPVVDAGAGPRAVARTLFEEDRLLDMITPVLVVAPRPDLLNRARTVFSYWDSLGVLARTVLVICCQIPTLNHAALTDMLQAAMTGQVAGVVGLDYDPILGAGTTLDLAAQENLTPRTWEAIAELAELTGSGADGQRQAVNR